MEYTGERYVPGELNAQAGYEHYHRYASTIPYAKGRRILDLASGEGYGTSLLASVASEIIGIDIDKQAIAHSSSQYIRSNLKFIQGSIFDIPIHDQRFDLITCFEAIEHVREQEKVLDEVLRLLSDDGLFMVSTPNKLVFTDEANQIWPWHVKEFYYSEFQEFLKNKFQDVIFLGQKVLTGSMIWPLEILETGQQAADNIFIQKHERGIGLVDAHQQKPMFFLAIASKRDLTELRKQIRANYLVDISLDLLKEKNNWIEKFKSDIEILNKIIQSKDADLANINNLLQHKDMELTNVSLLLQSREKEIENQTNSIKIKEDGFTAIVQEKEVELTNTKDLYLASKIELANIKNQLEATNVYIQRKEQDIRIALSALAGIHATMEWRLAQRIRSYANRLLPPGSISRKLAGMILRTIWNRSTNKGLKEKPVSAIPPLIPEVTVDGSPKIIDCAVCTIASKNYLSSVRVLAESIRKTNPSISMYVLLVDKVDGIFDPTNEPFQIITLDELNNIPNPQHFKFKYTSIELNTAAKPYFLEYLIEKKGLKKVCYFDPDIYVFQSLQGLWDLLNGYSIVLTPHITQPYEDDRKPSELEINLAGIFNLGFIGISDNETSRSFLQWWKERMYDYCFMAPAAGMHVDQNWINFAPVMRDNVFILRDPAYNIAYWNLHYRGKRLMFSGNNSLLIDEQPVIFYHFSGLNLENLEKISVHQDRYTLSDLPNLRPLFEWYRSLLIKHGYSDTRKWSYAYGYFDNGSAIPFFARQMYNDLGSEELKKVGDPFFTRGNFSFFSWLNEPVDNKSSERIITRLHMELYRLRKDLHAAFPDPLGRDRAAFRNWMDTGAVRDYNLDKSFIPADHVETSRSLSDRFVKLLFSTRYLIGKSARTLFKNNEKVKKALKTIEQALFRSVLAQTPVLTFEQAPPPHTLPPFGINLSGYIQGEFGVAEGSRASIQAIESAQIPFVLNNIKASIHRDYDLTYGRFSEKNPYRINLMHVNADVIQEYIKEKNTAYLDNRYNIAYWFWELSNFPSKWQSSFKSLNEIWVASTFCQESIAKVSPIPVVKMTFPIHINETQIVSDRKKFGLPKDKFLFLFSFDYLSIFERKNPLGVLRAFNSTFGGRDDVLLVLKGINMEHTPEKEALLAGEVNRPNIRLMHGHLNRRDMLTLIATCDSYISLHRSEGFGLGMAQAMYFGKPVIATGYSGNMEFMNQNNSFPVKYKLTELEQDYGPYEQGNVWAEPDPDHAGHLMQLISRNTVDVRKVAEQAKYDIQTKMTPAVTGREILDRLKLQIK